MFPGTHSRPNTVSLSTNEYVWLPMDAWETPQVDYFLQQYNEFPLRTALWKSETSRWILLDDTRHPLAWAEASQEKKSYITDQNLTLGGFTSEKTWENYGVSSLPLLLTAVFITQKPDLLSLVTPCPTLQARLNALDWPWNKRRVRAVSVAQKRPKYKLVELEKNSISKVEWEACSPGIEARKTLNYLVTRYAKK